MHRGDKRKGKGDPTFRKGEVEGYGGHGERGHRGLERLKGHGLEERGMAGVVERELRARRAVHGGLRE